jgi:hypothetical protein
MKGEIDVLREIASASRHQADEDINEWKGEMGEYSSAVVKLAIGLGVVMIAIDDGRSE